MKIRCTSKKTGFIFSLCFMVLAGCGQDSPSGASNSSKEPPPNKERVAEVATLIKEKSSRLNSAIFRAEADNGGNIAAGAEGVFKSLVNSQYISSDTLDFSSEMGDSYLEYNKMKYAIKYGSNNTDFGGDGKDDVLFIYFEKNAFNKEVCLAIQKNLTKKNSIPMIHIGGDYLGLDTEASQGCGEPIGNHYIYYQVMTTN